mgnify:CR=1 FL=1
MGSKLEEREGHLSIFSKARDFLDAFFVFVREDYFVGLHRFILATNQLYGEKSYPKLFKILDTYHQDGKLTYTEWKELRRVILERDF